MVPLELDPHSTIGVIAALISARVSLVAREPGSIFLHCLPSEYLGIGDILLHIPCVY